MNQIKKLLSLRSSVGFAIVGLFFAVCGLVVVFSGATDSLLPVVISLIGIFLFVIEARKIVREVKGVSAEKAQYDRVDRTEAERMSEEMTDNPDEAVEEFVYHFTGKLNQDQVMRTADGEVVYEALCEKMTMLKDTPFRFVDHLSGEESTKMISHTLTNSMGVRGSHTAVVSSIFRVDGTSVWDVIADMGYGFSFGMDGLTLHYTVQHWKKDAGFVESGGTGLMNPKYKDKAAGKIPTRGIYRVRCKRSDVPGFFLICFALSRTENTYT